MLRGEIAMAENVKIGSETVASAEKGQMTLFKDDRQEDWGAIIVSIIIVAVVVITALLVFVIPTFAKMFADLSGFTAMSEQMDPEAVRELMNDCFDHLVPVVEKYEGTVDKFIGDEIMALFGAPTAHENDAERALRAAWGMMESLKTFNAARNTDLGIDTQFTNYR